MTKLKNTKKGMAKKALSISLVAAMLATSNVPVWAAEFTDGSDAAVEAPVVEEFAAEAVEVEENVDDVATYAASDVKVTLTDWKTNDLNFEGELKDADNKPVTSFNYEFRIDGKEIVGHEGNYSGTARNGLSDLINTDLKLKPEDAGHMLSIDITAANGFATTLGPVEIKAVDVSNGKLTLGNNANLTYTGKQVAFTDDQIAAFTFSGTAAGLTHEDFTYSYEGEDLVNATKDEKYITLVATVNKTGYTGAIRVIECGINKLPINAADLELTLNKDSISYAERDTISSDMVTVKNTKTGETYPSSTYTVEGNLTNANDESALTVRFNQGSLAKDEKTNQNYMVNADVTKTTENKVKLTANNLSDFRIEVDSVRKEGFNDTKAENAIHFYLGDKEVTSEISDVLTYKAGAITDTSTSVDVVVSGDNKNIIGNTTVTIRLTLNEIIPELLNLDIDGAAWQGWGHDLSNVTYTGKEIVREVKNVKLGTGSNSVTLTTDDYKIEYVGDTTNAMAVSNKEVAMYVVGIGDYSGRVKLGEFAIEAAEIKADDVKVPETVQYDGSLQTAADYMDGKVTVKANTTVDGKAAKIDVPADAYKLDFTADKLEVGGKITTKLTSANILNKNFRVDNGTITKSNATLISNKSLADENVKVEVVGGPYVYTGKAVVPTLKVTVDGVELALDRDYEVKTSSNSVNAGTASVTVVGINDYSGSKTVNYVINKANLSDVKLEAKVSTDAEKEAFTYTGKQVKPKTENFKITLNGVELKSDDFAITYPTSSLTNVDAGEATVTLVPVKTNENFTGDKLAVKFNILPRALTNAELAGDFYAFDKDGNKIDFDSKYTFAYDGTEKTFEDVKYVPTKNTYNNMKLVEGKDYEIKYFNNITGPTAYVYVTGIGNYTNAADSKFDGSEVTYTDREDFQIEGVTVDQRNMELKDTEYAGDVATTPNLTIKVGSKTLVEGTDYEFITSGDTVNVTPANKVLKATLKLKGGYKLTNGFTWSGAFSNAKPADGTVDVTWKIVKKDLANTKITAEKVDNDLNVTVFNGNVIVPEKEYDVKDNGDGTVTVTAKTDSKNYTGSQKVSVGEVEAEVGAPIIKEVKVVGNKATVILEGEADNAVGYDYVISTENDYKNGRLPNGINKNQLVTETSYQYLDQGIYYAYCHAWKRVDGKKVFGGWSNIMPFSVSSITPSKPSVTGVKVSGSTVKVTYTKSANATGYDLVLGKSMKKVNGEMRPVEYGKLVKKVYKGNTVTATFTKVPKGSYYVGLHAYNRTSEDGKKVFSTWSNAKKITVK